MPRALLPAVFAVALILGADSVGRGDGPALKVATYNIRGDFDHGAASDKGEAWIARSGDHRRDRLLGVVEDLSADVLGVQEAYANQVDEITAALPEYAVYGVGRDDGRREGEHSAIYYRRDRFELEGSGTYWLCEESDTPGALYPGAACPRVASWVRLREAETERSLLVVNTHWDHVSGEAREYAAAMIRSRLSEVATPAIVMGDFNTSERSQPLLTLLDPKASPVLFDAYRLVHPRRGANEASYHGFRGGVEGSRIDYLLCTESFEPTAAEIVQSEETAVASDHYPIVVTLEPR